MEVSGNSKKRQLIKDKLQATIMADLDDFFAKKDRKRTKPKKFATPEDLAKKLEDTTKKNEVKPRKEPQSSLQSTQSDGVEIQSADQTNAPAEVSVFLERERVF